MSYVANKTGCAVDMYFSTVGGHEREWPRAEFIPVQTASALKNPAIFRLKKETH